MSSQAQTVSTTGRTVSVPYKGTANITLPTVTPGNLRTVQDYIIITYTPGALGSLFVGSSPTAVGAVNATAEPYSNGVTVPDAPAPQLRFAPAGSSAIGQSLSFRFVGTDYGIFSGNHYSAPVTFTINITNAAPVATTVTGNRILSSAGATVLAPTFAATDAENDIAYYTITGGLPTASQGVLLKNGAPVVLNTATARFTAAELAQLTFTPVAGYVGNVELSYTVTDGGAATSATVATYTFRVVTPPTAANVRTGAMLSSAGSTAIAALSATAAGGNTISSYTLKTLPSASAGTLYLNTTPVTAVRSFTPTEATQLHFDPAGTSSGEFSFTYTATNNEGLESAAATYTIPVANVPPVAVNDPTVTVARNVIATVEVLKNDSDSDGALAPATVDLDPTQPGLQQERTLANQGKFTVSAQGIVSFTPALNYAGTSTITYTVQDNLGLTSNAASIRVTVNNVTTAYDDSNEVEKNTTVSGNVILNDTDPQNTGFTVSLAKGVLHGSLTLNPDGSYTYKPATDFLGTDSFVYQACDKTANPQCVTATVHLNVYDPAVQCIAATGPNQLVNPGFESGNVGFNTNYEFKVDNPNSTDELTPENTYAIGPDASKYHGSFRGNGRGGAADNFLMINATSAIRTLYSQTFKVQPNRYYTFSAYFNNLIPPTANIADPIVGFVINGASTSGTITVPESPDQWVQYSDVWYSGNNTTATFEIRNLTLDLQGNDIGIDDLYFGTCNAVPVANNTATSPIAATAAATAITPLDATDSDGTIVSYTIAALPASAAGTLYVNGAPARAGQVVLPADNSHLSFDPSGSVHGNVTFTFYATDNTGSVSNTATYTIPVGNTAPLAENVLMAPAIPNTAGATVLKPLVATDGDGTIVKYVLVSAPNALAGTLSVGGTPVTTLPREVLPSQLGQLTFDPSGAYAGNVSFSYYAVDNQNNVSNTAIYTIPIGNQMPVAQNKSAPGMRNTTSSAPLGALESTDADGWIASYTIANLPAKGALTLNGVRVSPGQTIRPEQASELSYSPPQTETGQYQFTYYATDNLGGTSNIATYVVPVAGPLPVQLVGFTAKAVGTTAQLTWATSAELNNERFEVERSTDGRRFEQIGQVRGRGTTSVGATYLFSDETVPVRTSATVVYYRLKQVDTTSETAYSQVRTLTYEAAPGGVVVAPNPFSNKATLDLRQLAAGPCLVTIVDATGRVLYSGQLSGGQEWPLEVRTWPAGFYTVIVRDEQGARFTQRIVKQ
ncbi:tandem-95 repeat protein [Hymenobacter sp. HSC-4F20]|uniref:Ig-like domain-containing protein n=1 Tax=Hymenobacter sp. HSC-4F20 TaxID=2864135 RepID=UPI001C72A5ED|nr:tandem-95 repeat protein [Hymenobacter sp. HSC-4F20]MBX0291777.1 tandem-95 repeat protein [Hymenobacter sp. HSC-4F20]